MKLLEYIMFDISTFPFFIHHRYICWEERWVSIKASIKIIKYEKNSQTNSDGWEESLAPPPQLLPYIFLSQELVPAMGHIIP